METICGRENDMACPDSLSGETWSEHEARMDIITITIQIRMAVMVMIITRRKNRF